MEVAYKLVQFEGKGRGLVATRTLEVGELVLSERAFLKISFKSKITSFPRLIEFEPEIRAKLMNLSCPADSSLKDFFPSPLKITKHLVIFCQNKLAKARKTRTSPGTIGLKKFGLCKVWFNFFLLQKIHFQKIHFQKIH